MMTDSEREVVELLGEATNGFATLDQVHPSDLPEFVAAIHAAQNIVLARQNTHEIQATRPLGSKGKQTR